MQRGWGVGGGGVVTSLVWHSTDVRAECPPFSALPGIWLPPPPPPFSTKSIWMARFFWIPMWKAHFSNILVYAHFFRQRFFKAAYPLVFYELIVWILCNNKQEMVTKNGNNKTKGSIWIGKHFDDQVYELIGPFFQRPGICAHTYQNYP